MDNYADMTCVLKVNIHCEGCKWKVKEVLQNIRGVSSITIDAEKGTAKVSGKVDPNRLLMVLARSGQHAELSWVRLEQDNDYYNDNDYYSPYNNHWYNKNQRYLPPATYFPQGPPHVVDPNINYDDISLCTIL